LAVVLGKVDQSIDPLNNEFFKIFHEAQKYNSFLEVVCFNKEEFDTNEALLVKHIKKEGIKLI